MLSKLRRKFILICLSLVSAVLIGTFAVSLISQERQMVGDTYAQLEAMTRDARTPQRPTRGPFPGDPQNRNMLTFLLLTDDNGVLARRETFGWPDFTFADADLQVAINTILKSGHDRGIITIADAPLRYSVNIQNRMIAFADRTNEIVNTRSLLRTFALVGACSLLVLFAIAWFLARWATRPVEQAWIAQQRFVGDASHELKTPLTVLLADLGILRRHPDETVASQARWLDSMEIEGQRMNHLVGDLLTLARLEDAGAARVKRPVDLSRLVWSVLLTFEAVAFEAGKKLQSEITPDLTVLGDESDLERLARILIENAIKYGAADQAIDVRLESRDRQVSLSVANDGPVLPMDVRAHLFDRFYRADESRAQATGGFGLGLAIAQGIARAHNTEIRVSSDALKGTVFSVSLAAASSGGQ